MANPNFVNPYEQIWKTRDLRALGTPIELENNQSEFRRGLGAFGKEMQATGYGLAALGAQGLENVIGENKVTSGITDWGLEGYNKAIEESHTGYNAPSVARIEDIKGAADAMDWASFQLGKGLPMLASLAATGGVGGAVARLSAKEGVKQLAKSAIGDVVKKGVATKAVQATQGQIVTKAMQEAAAKALRDRMVTGAVTGGFAGSFGLEGGLAFGEQVAEGVDPAEAVKSAIAVGGINGALEFLPLYKAAQSIGMGGYAKKKIANIIKNDAGLSKKAVALATAKELGSRAGKGAAVGAVAEGVTEGLQELTSIAGLRWAKGDPLFAELSDDDWSRIANATASGTLVGGTAAGAGATVIGPQGTETTPPPAAPGAPPVQTPGTPTPQTRTQVLEAMQGKITADLEAAQAAGDVKRVEDLQKIRELYDSALAQTRTEETAIPAEPIVEAPVQEGIQEPVIETPVEEVVPPAAEPVVEEAPDGTIRMQQGDEITLTPGAAPTVRVTPTQEEVEALRQRMGPRPERQTTQPIEETANAQEVQAQTEAEVKGTPPLYSKPIAKPAPTFYSALERTTQEAKQQKAPATQWENTLDNMVKKGLVKQEELDWSGTKDWLKEQKGVVTKEELLQHVRDNTLEVQETEFRYDFSFKQVEPDFYAKEWLVYDAEGNVERVSFNIAHTQAEAVEYLKGTPPRNTQWIEPGGTNQRELVLTVPSIEPFNTDTTHYGDVGGGKAVAWVRFNDRVDGDGKKTLFLEEVQSKRHQEGKEEGYSGSWTAKKLLDSDVFEVKLESFGEKSEWTVREKDGSLITARDTKEETINDALSYLNEVGIPDAPFKQTIAGSGQTLSGWAGLAFKRMLKYAVENGYDKVAWTTGEQQAKRYSLAQRVAKVIYTSDGYFQAYDRNGRVVMSSLMDENEVSNYIGKELTNELLAAPVKDGERTVELVEDKVIGGEGMKGFYDRLLPNEINKYIKKWGAKVDKTQMEFGDKSASVHSVEITPAMRDSVGQGQPLFSKPIQTTPEFKRWSRGYPVIEDAKVGAANAFETGKPFVAKVYHGSESNLIEEFDPNKLGGNTGAASARKGFFFAGNPETTTAYVSTPIDVKKIKLEFGGVPYDQSMLTDGDPKTLALVVLHRKATKGFEHNAKDITEVDKNNLINETLDELNYMQEENDLFAAKYSEKDVPLEDEIPDSLFSTNDTTYGDAAKWLEQNKDAVILESKSVEPLIQPTTYPVYVRMSNPMVYDQKGAEYRETTYNDLLKQARDNGHDGLVILNTYDGGPLDNIFVVFDNKDIKGYFNKGTFDETGRLLESKQPGTTKVPLQDLQSNIDSIMGQGWLQQAQELGLVEVIEGAGPNGEAGSWAGDRIRLYTDTMPKDGSPAGVLLHEGKHVTFEDVLGNSLPAYVKDLHTLAKNGNKVAQDAITHAAIAAADVLGIKHNLLEGGNKTDLANLQALIEERRPGLLAEEELAYFVQYGTDAQGGAGFFKRLINQIKAWFAQTRLGQRMKELGMSFELTEGMAVEWAKMGLSRSLENLRQAEKVRVRVEKQASTMPASARLGRALEALNENDPLYSMGIQEIRENLWNDPTDVRPEIVNKPGLLQKWRGDFIDFFAEMEKKSERVYEAYSLMRSKKAGRIEQARQEYFIPLRTLVANSPWTAKEVGDMLAARHIKIDDVNLNLARRASDSYTKELLKALSITKKKELMKARVNVKAGKMPDGSQYIDANGTIVNMPKATKRQLMFDLMNQYSQYEIVNPDGIQALREEWELFKDAAGGFSSGGVGSTRVRTVADVLQGTSKDQAKFDQIANLFDAANRHTLEILEDGGLLTAEEHARLLTDKSAYAPLRRESYNVDNEVARLFQRAGQGGSKQIATRSGTENLSEPTLVLQNALAAIEAAAAAAERNLANKELYKVVVQDKEGWKPWFTIIEKDKYITHDEDGFLQEKHATASNQADITLINDGKKLVIRPNMHNERAMGFVRAANNLDAQILNGPMKVLGWANSIVRWVNVTASPVFLMMNTIRDPFTAAYNLQASEAAPYTKEIFENYGSAFKALKKVFMDGNRDPTDPDVQWVEKWELAGGRASFIDNLRAMDDTWRSFDAQVARRQAGGIKQLMQAKDKWIDGLENFNLLFENVMRFSTFKVLVEKGVVTPSRAARISQELTTNYTRRGYKTQALGAWWVFFNAAVQGNYQVLRNLMASKKLQALAGGTVVFALMLDLLGRALADDWDEIPEWDKERFIILPVKVGGDFIKIPAPWVYNVLWRTGGMLGETLAGVKKPQDVVLDIAALTMSVFNPLGKPGSIAQAISPTGLDPFVQILENKDFAGNPIGPEGFPGAGSRANSELLWSSTPKGYQSIARWVNEFTGGSATESGKIDLRPGDYQLLVNFLTGSLGRFMSDATFGMKEALETGEGPKDIPIVKEFFSDPYDPMRSQKYHTNIAGIYGAHKLEQMYSKGPERDLIKLQAVRKDRGEELRMYSQAQDVERQLKSLRVRLKAAQNRGDLQREREIKKRMEMVQERFNERYKQRVG